MLFKICPPRQISIINCMNKTLVAVAATVCLARLRLVMTCPALTETISPYFNQQLQQHTTCLVQANISNCIDYIKKVTSTAYINNI